MTLYLLKISAFTHNYIKIDNQFNMEVNTEGEAPRTRKKKKSSRHVDGAALIRDILHNKKGQMCLRFTSHSSEAVECTAANGSGCSAWLAATFDTNCFKSPLVKPPQSRPKSAAALRERIVMSITDHTHTQSQHKHSKMFSSDFNFINIPDSYWFAVKKKHFVNKACQRLLWLVGLPRTQEVGGSASLTVRLRDGWSSSRGAGSSCTFARSQPSVTAS